MYCAFSRPAAAGEGPSLSSLAEILVGEGLSFAPQSPQKTTWTITTANVTAWKSGQLILDTVPHSDFWALQETDWPGSEHMAAAQRWPRKGWAAIFHAAEMVGQHIAANRGGVAPAGPAHISWSVPNEFEFAMDDAAFRTPAGTAPGLFLRSRVLARHIHAMLEGGFTLVGVRGFHARE